MKLQSGCQERRKFLSLSMHASLSYRWISSKEPSPWNVSRLLWTSRSIRWHELNILIIMIIVTKSGGDYDRYFFFEVCWGAISKPCHPSLHLSEFLRTHSTDTLLNRNFGRTAWTQTSGLFFISEWDRKPRDFRILAVLLKISAENVMSFFLAGATPDIFLLSLQRWSDTRLLFTPAWRTVFTMIFLILKVIEDF